jgi:hypothetical protein
LPPSASCWGTSAARAAVASNQVAPGEVWLIGSALARSSRRSQWWASWRRITLRRPVAPSGGRANAPGHAAELVVDLDLDLDVNGVVQLSARRLAMRRQVPVRVTISRVGHESDATGWTEPTTEHDVSALQRVRWTTQAGLWSWLLQVRALPPERRLCPVACTRWCLRGGPRAPPSADGGSHHEDAERSERHAHAIGILVRAWMRVSCGPAGAPASPPLPDRAVTSGSLFPYR